jgi:glycosyltransferase involved in cell wall biosynthesis
MVSHTASSMGQLEQIGDAGEVVEDYQEYSNVMKKLMNNKNYYVSCKANAEKRFREIYNVPSIISKFVNLYKEAANA